MEGDFRMLWLFPNRALWWENARDQRRLIPTVSGISVARSTLVKEDGLGS